MKSEAEDNYPAFPIYSVERFFQAPYSSLIPAA
jgi:hypothetical protein